MSKACFPSVSKPAKAAAVFGTACVLATNTLAGPAAVESFDAAAWARLQAELPRPSAVVFTATYCASCPAVLATLSHALEKGRLQGDVVAVVIDEAAERELLESDHYAHASRLFLFAGNEAKLRYQIDPRWRGVTPYVALLSSGGKTTFAAGPPSAAHIEAWARSARSR
jgi:hypothetical protein